MRRSVVILYDTKKAQIVFMWHLHSLAQTPAILWPQLSRGKPVITQLPHANIPKSQNLPHPCSQLLRGGYGRLQKRRSGTPRAIRAPGTLEVFVGQRCRNRCDLQLVPVQLDLGYGVRTPVVNILLVFGVVCWCSGLDWYVTPVRLLPQRHLVSHFERLAERQDHFRGLVLEVR